MTRQDVMGLALLATVLLSLSSWLGRAPAIPLNAADAAASQLGLSHAAALPGVRPLTEAETRRLSTADRLASHIIESRRLTADDVRRLSEQLEGLPWRQTLAVRGRIADAVNRQALAPAEWGLRMP